jgi:hypothetical protein
MPCQIRTRLLRGVGRASCVPTGMLATTAADGRWSYALRNGSDEARMTPAHDDRQNLACARARPDRPRRRSDPLK